MLHVSSSEFHVNLDLLTTLQTSQNVGALIPQVPRSIMISKGVWPLKSRSQTLGWSTSNVMVMATRPHEFEKISDEKLIYNK